MLKSQDFSFLLFAEHLPASMLNPFESVSYLKVIYAQSLGNKEALWALSSQKHSHNNPVLEA